MTTAHTEDDMTRMSSETAALAVVLAVALSLTAPPLAVHAEDAPQAATGVEQLDTLPGEARNNPFAGFETHFLSNGMKLWFKKLEGAPNVTASVVVPYGRDLDPAGKEQLAHFTEHMLFSDHDGRTEEEVKDAVEGIGGIRNGITFNDKTFYYVTIANEHGLFAIEWLSRIMSPHDMDPEVVDRARQPVAVEINARPREFFEYVGAALNPNWLIPPDFWEHEFGLTGRALMHDPWVSLNNITAEDLAGFYERYYAPAAMTLTIVGDLDSQEVVELAERTFGAFPAKEVAPQEYQMADPGRRRATYAWLLGSDVGYDRRFKFFNLSAQDELHVLFIRDLLQRRLNQRLRYGERKAAYGVAVQLIKRGPASYLRISGDINEDEYDYAVQVFDEELEQIRSASLDPAVFEEDRTAVIERQRTSNLTSQALNFWSRSYFYNSQVHTDFPDVLGFYEGVTQEQLSAFANRSLVADRETHSVIFLQPISQGVIVLALILLGILTHRGISWTLTRPIEMKKIRYVARFRTPLLIRFVRVAVFAGLGLVLGRLFVALLFWVGSEWVATVNSYVVQTASYTLMLCGSIAAVVLYLSRFPRKLLVFPDHIRVKSRAYASRSITPADIAEISMRRFPAVWLSPDLLGCTALTFGMLRPGLYIRPKKGRALFFRTRDTDELKELLEEWRGEPIGGAQASAPIDAPAQSAAGPNEPSDEESVHEKDAANPDMDDAGLTEEEKRELLGE